MNMVVVLFICVVAALGIAESHGEPPKDQAMVSCSPEFEHYHHCRRNHTEKRHHHQVESRKKALAAIDHCFINHGCQPPKHHKDEDTPEHKKCAEEIRAAKKKKVRDCVQGLQPDYHHPEHQPHKHHLKHKIHHFVQHLLNIRTDGCANSDAVKQCKRHVIKHFRRVRFQSKCASKEFCSVLMSQKCQHKLREVRNAKCMCKVHVRQDMGSILSQFPSCPAPKHTFKANWNVTCPVEGYCRKGYSFWVHDHALPTLKLGSQSPQAPAGPSGQAAGAPDAPPSPPAPSGPSAPPAPPAPLAPQAPQAPQGGPQQPTAPQAAPASSS